MSVKARKPSTGRPREQNAGVRKDVQEALDRVWPDGVVELSFDSAESYFDAVQPKLSRALNRIPHTRPLQEREAEGGPIWWDDSDPEEDPPDDTGRSRSYHLFFVSPEGEAFTFETETERISEPEFITEEFEEAGWGEGPPIGRISGTGRTGWVVAVSLVAPFAVVELGEVATFEDGSTAEAEIESHAETAGGARIINPEEHFQKANGAEVYQILVKLRGKISDILEKHGIAVLPPEEWRKPVPWLRGGEDTIPGMEGRTMRVLDAFFFEEL